MCDFCEKREEIKTGTGHWGIIKAGKKYGMYYRHRECQNSCGVEILHCPMCGRKLSEETENPSTEELFATLKEKMTEEDYKTLQNGIKSFSDGVNVLWSVLGKGLETEKHSDQFRQTLKEVAEEMPASGKYDGAYAFHCGSFGYIGDDGLYRIDFSCSNCGKRHEGVIFGNDVTCECGKIIRTGFGEETEN